MDETTAGSAAPPRGERFNLAAPTRRNVRHLRHRSYPMSLLKDCVLAVNGMEVVGPARHSTITNKPDAPIGSNRLHHYNPVSIQRRFQAKCLSGTDSLTCDRSVLQRL
jgi:hypothetical protein